MSKFFNSKIIEKDSEDITNLQSNLNEELQRVARGARQRGYKD